jgi:hypothetical protein
MRKPNKSFQIVAYEAYQDLSKYTPSIYLQFDYLPNLKLLMKGTGANAGT